MHAILGKQTSFTQDCYEWIMNMLETLPEMRAATSEAMFKSIFILLCLLNPTNSSATFYENL